MWELHELLSMQRQVSRPARSSPTGPQSVPPHARLFGSKPRQGDREGARGSADPDFLSKSRWDGLTHLLKFAQSLLVRSPSPPKAALSALRLSNPSSALPSCRCVLNISRSRSSQHNSKGVGVLSRVRGEVRRCLFFPTHPTPPHPSSAEVIIVGWS